MTDDKIERSPLLPSLPDQEDEQTSTYIKSHEIELSKNTFKVYKRRWYVLGVFTAIATVCNMEWNAWGPIAEPCQIVFGWKNWQILFLASWVGISTISAAGPLTWLMDMRGLRLSVVLCAFFMTAGKALQVIPTNNITTRTILVNAGQCLTMIGCPVAFGAPPSISARWFPSNERTTATAVSTLAAYLGIALSFAIGPAMVPTLGPTKVAGNLSNATSLSYYSEHDKNAMESNITNFMGLQLAMSGVLFLSVLVYFPNRPPLPPSPTSVKTSLAYKEGVVRLRSNGSYWLLALLFGVSFGVYFGWLSVFALAVRPFNIDQTLAGWLGCATTSAGIISGLMIARFADYVKHYTKYILMLLFCGTAVSQLFFSLTCSQLIPFSETLLFASIICGGLFFNGTTPLLFELAMECVYPVAEGITANILLVAGNIVYLTFSISFMFPTMDVKWMNWFTVAATGACAIGLLFYKGTYSRLDLDSVQFSGSNSGEVEKNNKIQRLASI